MRLSTRTRYGTRAVVELARHYEDGPLPLHLIAQEQDLSVKYLEQLMTTLKSGNLVRSFRGVKGGYMLSKSPDKINMSDVFVCLEGPNCTVDCIEDNPTCDRVSTCPMQPLWRQLNDAIMHVFQGITLQDLIERQSQSTFPGTSESVIPIDNRPVDKNLSSMD